MRGPALLVGQRYSPGMDAEQVVNGFIEAIGRKDEAAAMAFVADNCYYDNVPVGDMTGKDKMAEFL